MDMSTSIPAPARRIFFLIEAMVLGVLKRIARSRDNFGASDHPRLREVRDGVGQTSTVLKNSSFPAVTSLCFMNEKELRTVVQDAMWACYRRS